MDFISSKIFFVQHICEHTSHITVQYTYTLIHSNHVHLYIYSAYKKSLFPVTGWTINWLKGKLCQYFPFSQTMCYDTNRDQQFFLGIFFSKSNYTVFLHFWSSCQWLKCKTKFMDLFRKWAFSCILAVCHWKHLVLNRKQSFFRPKSEGHSSTNITSWRLSDSWLENINFWALWLLLFAVDRLCY